MCKFSATLDSEVVISMQCNPRRPVGKTHAMSLLASKVRTQAWVISASKLVNNKDACELVTKKIQQEDGIWMIDEAEVLFPPKRQHDATAT
jgi:hypothetical protein